MSDSKIADEALRNEVLQKLGLTGASQETQDAALYKIEQIANRRIALVIPELLTPEQTEAVEQKRKAGEDDDAVIDWVVAQIPQFDDLLKASILDVVDDFLAHSADSSADQK